MSKASEWAAAAGPELPESWGRDERLVFHVNDVTAVTAAVTVWPTSQPRLTIFNGPRYSHATLEPAEALALARWILDTFGETP